MGYDNEFENTVFLNSYCIFIQIIEYSKVFFVFASSHHNVEVAKSSAPPLSARNGHGRGWGRVRRPDAGCRLRRGLEHCAAQLGAGFEATFGKPALVDF